MFRGIRDSSGEGLGPFRNIGFRRPRSHLHSDGFYASEARQKPLQRLLDIHHKTIAFKP